MSGQSAVLPDALPRSHYFLTVSRGSGMRTVAVRSILVHCALVLLPFLALVGLGSTLYVVFHDDLVAELMRRQSAMQYAYEDRVEALQQDLEQQSERGRADLAKLETRIHELFAREAKLQTNTSAVTDLVSEAGVTARGPALPPEITGRIPSSVPNALGFAPSDKPHPLLEPATHGPTGARGAAHLEDHASLLDDSHVPVGDRLDTLDASLDRVARDQTVALSRIGTVARQRVVGIRSLIEDTGLSPDRYLAKSTASAAMGGPFVPLPEGADGAFGRAAAELRGAVSSAALLGAALGRLPLAAPLSGRQEVTSPFGARVDPFLGRPALHTGVDLREGYGTDIRATGGGRVVFAGTAGGYGNMVELDHGNGVSSRYAHMGGIAVSEGQTVTRGTVLGYVGATGRATGPHLHYEVRIDGEPVDPMRFLAESDRLAAVETP